MKDKSYHPVMYDPSFKVGDSVYYKDDHTNGLELMKIIKVNKIGFVTLAKDESK